MRNLILVIDQGTTSTRVIVFSPEGEPLFTEQEEFTQYFPKDGWVEHDAEEIWQSTLTLCRRVLDRQGCSVKNIAAIGITNQRETTIVWNKRTGKPVYRAIVWQDRRTAKMCDDLRESFEQSVRDKTGLILDSYFSATKVQWILDNVDGARAAAECGDLLFGTVDCYLLWKLTAGKSHKTDATNASRTMLFNIHDQVWDSELLKVFNVPESLLPEVCDCSHHFGDTDKSLLGESIPVTGMAGDQQAALIGQACFQEGMAKSTYGTGCFLIMNTGDVALVSENKLLTTIAYRIDGKVSYGIEGSIFISGAAVQWLRDGLQLINHAQETEAIAEKTKDSKGVVMVPAFTGLGAPYWDSEARGAILGLTRDTGIGELVVATLQSVCFQTKDLINAMESDGIKLDELRVDGGMVGNNWLMQELANVLGLNVERPVVPETTALGAAYLAGLEVGLFASLEDISQRWKSERLFKPILSLEEGQKNYDQWLDAVKRVSIK